MAKLSSSLWIVTLTFLINLSRCEKIQNVYPAIKSFNVENYFKSETFKDLLKSGRLSELCGKHFEMWFDGLSKGDAWALQSKLLLLLLLFPPPTPPMDDSVVTTLIKLIIIIISSDGFHNENNGWYFYG